jgi:GNAT superfamily N-acetyltransferase
MQIRPATLADLDRIREIDATIESTQYLHLERNGDPPTVNWSLVPRPLRTKLLDNNAVTDDLRFSLKQVLGGAEDGLGLSFEHEGDLAALAVARIDADANVLRLLDLRVDYDLRRQGIGTAMLFRLIAAAREREFRAVTAVTLTNHFPACQFLIKASFELTGHDTHLHSNHDLVKEAVSLFWYSPLD